MYNLPDLTPFLKNPGLVSKLLKEVINHLEKEAINDNQKENTAQLQEIAKSIDRLEKKRFKVPNTLRAEKTKLVAALSASEKAEKELVELISDLTDIVSHWYGYSSLAPLNKNKVSGRRSTAPVTNSVVLRENIILALRKLNGCANANKVITVMGDMLEHRLTPRDYEQRQATGDLVWQNNAKWERFRMVKEGILKSNSPRGIWELNEEYL